MEVGSAPPVLGGPFPLLSLGKLGPSQSQALQGAVEEMWALWSPREASFESPNMTFPLWEAQEAEQMGDHLSLKKNGKVCH